MDELDEPVAVCENCDNPEDSCNCCICRNCDEPVGNVCSDDHCSDCCDCDDEDGSGDSPRLRGRFAYLGNASKDVPRYISLELEYDGCRDGWPIKNACELYGDAIVSDGSLSDDGFEINTNPSRGPEYRKHIATVVSATDRQRAIVNKSTGLHVHVDARDLNWHDMYKLALLYSKVEDALFQMVPQSRQKNRYCDRVDGLYLGDAKDYKHTLLNTIYRESDFPKNRKDKKRCSTDYKKNKKVIAQRCDKYHSARYYAMNVHTFMYRGTIEFRHAQSTTNTTKATNWGLVCMWIVESASKMTHAQITKLPSNSTLALLAILPKELGDWVITRQADLENR